MSRNMFRLSIVSLLIAILLFPLLILGLWSLSSSWPWPYLLPPNLSFEFWLGLLDSTNPLWAALRESLIIALGVTVMALLVSIPAAKALAFYQFPAKKLIKMLILAPLIVPPLAVTMGIQINFIRFGLSGTTGGVILVHLIPTIPYTIKILSDTFKVRGNKLEEQAQILGANPAQRFFYITLPLLKPGILAAGMMSFIISFSQYFITFLIGEGRIITLPMLIFPLVEQGNRTLGALYSWIFILIILLFIALFEFLLKNRALDHKK